MINAKACTDTKLGNMLCLATTQSWKTMYRRGDDVCWLHPGGKGRIRTLCTP